MIVQIKKKKKKNPGFQRGCEEEEVDKRKVESGSTGFAIGGHVGPEHQRPS